MGMCRIPDALHFLGRSCDLTMSTLYISFKPPKAANETNYRINPQTYAEMIKEMWPDAKVISPPDTSTYILAWELNTPHRLGISGGLQSDEITVSFGSNPQENAVDFILWHRGVIPLKEPLFLFDDNLTIVHELKSDMSHEELREIMGCST